MIIPSSSACITSDIKIEQWPKLIAEAIGVAESAEQRDIVLLSALTTCSYAMPNVYLLHGRPQRVYYPNLMTLIIAPPASGKGLMEKAAAMLNPIDEVLHTLGGTAVIAADSTYAAFNKMLSTIGGQAFVEDSEIDVITGAWKRDYNRYSALFRKAFEHDKISRSTLDGPKNLDTHDIPNPRVSLLLSGTFSQVRPLLGSGENGLASRFIPYVIDTAPAYDETVFYGNDRINENGLQPVFERLGQELYGRWKWMLTQDHQCLWCLTPEQEVELGGLFHDFDYMAFVDDEIVMPEIPAVFRAFIKRLGVIIKRVGAILSMLRLKPEGNMPERLYCSEADFDILRVMTEKLLWHALKLSYMLVEQDAPKVPVRRNTTAAGLIDALPVRFTTAEAVSVGAQMGLTDRTVKTWIKRECDARALQKVSHGKYRKL